MTDRERLAEAITEARQRHAADLEYLAGVLPAAEREGLLADLTKALAAIEAGSPGGGQ